MKKIITISLCLFTARAVLSQVSIDSSLLLYPENIIEITFENNDRIKASYYQLESAKNNFKLFESEYTQFNPLILSPSFTANSDKEYSSDMTAGVQKEFFNGTSISTEVGTNNEWGANVDRGTINLIEAEIGFPLFSSSRVLERIIKRTYEENELYAKHLDYVDAVRNNLHSALEQYYDLVPRIKIHEMLKEYRKELSDMLEGENQNIRDADKEQIGGEITSLNSKITGWEIMLYRLQLDLQRFMNVEHIDLDQLIKIEIDFSQPQYFGEYYLNEVTDSIYNKALINDTEFKVLGLIKNNAEEKKRLAEKGKWDIYATTGGRYNFYAMTGAQREDGYLYADAGLNIKINDRKVLKYTIAKAQADINAIDYTITDRRKFIQADILQLQDGLIKKKEQLISTNASLLSWKRTYAAKKAMFISEQESVDNLIQAFRSLVSTHETLFQLENNYLDLIRDLDYVCGQYFTVINLDSQSIK